MFTWRGRFFVTLSATIPFGIIEDDLWINIFEAFDLSCLNAPLGGIDDTEIALSFVWEVEDKFPFVDSGV